MFPIENRNPKSPVEKSGIKAKRVKKWLLDNDIIRFKEGYKDIDADECIRMLRNGLAHYRIKVEYDMDYNTKNDVITILIIEGFERIENMINGKNEITYNEVCDFRFSVDKLHSFVEYMVSIVLNKSSKYCKDCIYNDYLIKTEFVFDFNSEYIKEKIK